MNINSKQIDLSQIIEICPDLPEYLNKIDGAFKFLDGQLIFCDTQGSILKINAKSELEYHKRYFFKNSIYKELLAKAIGIKKGLPKPRVVDLTGGTLKDSLLLYSFGVDLTVVERNPIAAALIFDAIKSNDLAIEFFYMSAKDKIFECDVAYFDPMYDHKNDRAAPKKEMRIFRDIIGIDKDDQEIATMLKSQYKRLVIKRSTKAQPLLDSPNMSFKGKSTRYDVYLNLD